MKKKTYHHGDLRNTMIETGINLINEKGIHEFSLRKVAAACGVSHTAPYSHFKDIDELIHAMGEHVTNQFMDKFLTTAKEQEDHSDIINALGKAYILFFTEHPNYFQFLFSSSGVTINLDDDNSDDYPPFTLFRELAYQTFDKAQIPKIHHKKLLITLWAMVHGISSLLTNENICYSGDWSALLENSSVNFSSMYCKGDV